MNVQFTGALLCDQVRQELNLKFIIIGVYSASVAFASFPSVSQFQLFAHSRMTALGKCMLSVRVMVDGVENHRLEAEVVVEQPGEDWVTLPLQPIQFLVPGVLSVEYADETGEWIEFFQIKVVRTSGA
jgi:hypothetical protein